MSQSVKFNFWLSTLRNETATHFHICNLVANGSSRRRCSIPKIEWYAALPHFFTFVKNLFNESRKSELLCYRFA